MEKTFKSDSSTYATWHAPSASIRFSQRVMAAIHEEVLGAFVAVPKRGAEVGGVLLGRREGNEIVIEDFEPVPCEHRFGPSYRLSEADHEILRETIEWFRSAAHSALSIIGLYRSHTGPDFAPGPEDLKVLSTYFANEGIYFLLIKPVRLRSSVANFFLWERGAVRPLREPAAFPFEQLRTETPGERRTPIADSPVSPARNGAPSLPFRADDGAPERSSPGRNGGAPQPHFDSGAQAPPAPQGGRRSTPVPPAEPSEAPAGAVAPSTQPIPAFVPPAPSAEGPALPIAAAPPPAEPARLLVPPLPAADAEAASVAPPLDPEGVPASAAASPELETTPAPTVAADTAPEPAPPATDGRREAERIPNQPSPAENGRDRVEISSAAVEQEAPGKIRDAAERGDDPEAKIPAVSQTPPAWPRPGIAGAGPEPLPLSHFSYRPRNADALDSESDADSDEGGLFARPMRFWPMIVIAAILIGGLLGYLSVDSGSSIDQNAPAKDDVARQRSTRNNGEQQPADTAKPSPIGPPLQSSGEPRPEPLIGADSADRSTGGRLDNEKESSPETAAAVRSVLDRWTVAVKRGDAEAASALYTPTVKIYFRQKHATREDVRKSIRQMLGKYGRLDIYRVANVRVTSDGPDHAIATFDKHWQTSGRKKFAGEERERLGLLKTGGEWKIDSEEEVKLYWVQKER
jgi:uncharacterized protein (TIGR02246 family)